MRGCSVENCDGASLVYVVTFDLKYVSDEVMSETGRNL
jgi:hypothetical protein